MGAPEPVAMALTGSRRHHGRSRRAHRRLTSVNSSDAGAAAPVDNADAAQPASAAAEDDVVRLATIGDIVTIHFTCTDPEGQVLESSRDGDGEPMSFELGAGEIMGNKLFQGFDEAVRGLAVGQKTVIEASGGEWQRELLFSVPKDHPEVTRLEGRYKNQGGLRKDMLVELANGSLAVLVEISDDIVKIDANNMMAGKTLLFELELLAISKPDPQAAQQQQQQQQQQ